MKGLIQMSKYAGMREDLVQAGGGNSAFKERPGRMAVKASGFQLSDLTGSSGYAVVDPEIIRDAFLSCSNLDRMTEEDSKKILQKAFLEGARPSIETFLHSISGKYSLHTHPIVVNILTCRDGGMEILQRMFPEAMMVAYATPGIELAKAYFSQYKKSGRNASAVFLQNHGLLVSAETADEVIARTEQIVSQIEKLLGMDMSGYHAATELYQLFEEGILWRVTDQNVLDAKSVLGRTWEYSFCPDCVVFLGKAMYDAGMAPDKERLEDFRSKYGEPVVIAYKDGLYIHAQSVRKALEIQSVFSFAAQVMKQNEGYGCRLLKEEEQDFLLNWDAEKYRKKM